MEAQALLRINSNEARFLPVELKVRMLMEQAGMRMRASAMVGKRISQLDDVIRVQALMAIVIRATKASSANEAAASETVSEPSDQREEAREEPEGPCLGPSMRCPPSADEVDMFARMAVSGIKTVLFQIVEEAEAETAKDIIDAYDGLITTEDLCLAASEGFPNLNVDSLLLTKHLRYRKLVASRQRYLIRKLGVLLDMKEGLDTLLDLASDASEDYAEVETLGEGLADVDLTSPEDEVAATKLSSTEGMDSARTPRRSSDLAEGAAVRSRFLLATPSAKAKANAMSALQNTTWDREASSEDTTEDETDADTPPQAQHVAEISPSR